MMVTFLLTTVLFWICAHGEDVEVLFPERIHHTRTKRDLSTLLKEQHEDAVTLKIPTVKRGDLILDLKKSDSPFPSHGIALVTYDEKKNPKRKQITPEHCHYIGTIRNQKDSNVYISSCDGLTGTLDYAEGRFDIEPLDDTGAHKLYKVDDEIESILRDKLKFVKSDAQNDQAQYIKTHSQAQAGASTVRHYNLVNVEPQYIPFLTTQKTRYIEMFMSVSYELYQRYNSNVNKVIERVLNAVGQVDKSYSAINIRLVVVAIEIMTTGPLFVRRMEQSGQDLGNFRNHVNNVLKPGVLSDIRFDNSHFFSNSGWEGRIAGKGYLNGICTAQNSISIDGWSPSISGPTTIIGHELGHNMNFPHDAEDCNCLTPRGCFMGGTKTSRPGFSDCNMRALAAGAYTCLNDQPQNPLQSICGNGIKETGEECDCGTPEMCIRNDPCCDPYGCRFKEEAQCDSSLECCDAQCQFKSQGALCRQSASNCDAPEYCTGTQAACPVDNVRIDGTPCGESKTLIHANEDRDWTTVHLTPSITAQYFKIVPKYWKKNGYACLQMEMYGCNAPRSLGGAPQPTSLNVPKLYFTRPLCITPDITSCEGDVPDGTLLKYKFQIQGTCNYTYMMFVHQTDGTLVHHCSGKKVCPNSAGDLVVSSQCGVEDSKYERQPDQGWSLKHTSTGRCVLAQNSWPGNNKVVNLRPLCHDTESGRTTVNMANADCQIPLGFETGDLPDSAFTFGPSTRWPERFRAGSSDSGAWCAESKESMSWVQINFGKLVEVRSMKTKGSNFDWVTGFYLLYSNDGVNFNYYMETSGPNTQEETSYCYQGICAPIYDHQCQKLWSAKAKTASEDCWNRYNTQSNGLYGTCNPLLFAACTSENVKCGQLQCSDPAATPYHMPDFGNTYSNEVINRQKCSLAKVVGTNDEPGIGMVADGTKCGAGKICVGQVCATPQQHGGQSCPTVNGQVCAGLGWCLSDGTCFCHDGYDPATNCLSLVVAVNGGWSTWSTWTSCTKVCGSGRKRRHRFCNNPYAKHGGTPCAGERTQEQACNTNACIVGRTCKDIKSKMERTGITPHDGVYDIKPTNDLTLRAYCDMTRNGGGWTLVVSSHTNSWTADNVRLRNVDAPALFTDYSIFNYGNLLKESYLIASNKYQYRLEANVLGKWGGIWEAPIMVDAASSISTQASPQLVEKFSEWDATDYNHVPYVVGQRITIGAPQRYIGSITDNRAEYFPSQWINGDGTMKKPEHVWYWIREGTYINPKSCAEIMFRGFERNLTYASGVYKIEPTSGGGLVETYCDFDRHGGGWTLLMKSGGTGGWTNQNLLNRAYGTDEFSIFGLYGALKGNDVGETTFDYMIESEGANNENYGGIFAASRTDTTSSPTVVKKFGDWDETVENIARHQLKAHQGVIGAYEGQIASDTSGIMTIGSTGVFMTSQQNPTSVKVWIRAGGSRRSCNDLRIHGHHNGKDDYTDGFYMINNSRSVFCDMTTTPNEGWTLIVTSANKGWNLEQVYRRNENHPLLMRDYSILEMADGIKSLSHGTHFKYMMSAGQRNHWGGIWKAPIGYSFVSTDKHLRDVELLQQFDTWPYDQVWWKCPCKRFPYIALQSNRALLLSSQRATGSETGVIISNESSRDPAPWIVNGNPSPGVIWYWLNENDCEGNSYSRVNGGYSLSDWSACSVQCGGDGVQRRHRTCNNPAPRCGGDPCDPSVSLVEERSCNIPC